nr:L-aspartate oxidase [Acidimicrobiia bacterium]
AESLAAATHALDAVPVGADGPESGRSGWEATNLLTVATAMVAAAAARTESRGCHRRTDFPDPRPEWLTHLDVSLGAGTVSVRGGPVTATAAG